MHLERTVQVFFPGCIDLASYIACKANRNLGARILHPKEWFYYDPNFAKATFTTQAQIRDALKSTLKSGRTKNLLEHFGSSDIPEYRFSVFGPIHLNGMTYTLPPSLRNVDELFNVPL